MRVGAKVDFKLPDIMGGDATGHDRAVLRAGSEALRALRAEAVRKVRESRTIKASTVRDAMVPNYPTAGTPDPVWRLRVSGRPMPVAAYPHRQVRAGVSVQIKAGSRAVIRHAFVATMKSGHEGVFKRTGRFRYEEGKRGPRRRETIREIFTTRITDVFKDPGFADDAVNYAMAVFKRAYLRNLRALGVRTS